MDTETRGGGEALWDTSRTKLPVTKTKHLAERENVQGAKQRLLATKRKKTKQKSLMQRYIWFHGCKLDCIHVTIAYAIR